MKRYLVLALALLSLAVFAYHGVLRLALLPWLTLPALLGGMQMMTIFLLLFSLFHAWYMLGGRHALIFFAITAVVSWAFEQIGVATGLIYGGYHYTALLGPKLGHVPLLIPLAWFMMIYPSYVIANLIADAAPTGTRGGLRRVIWLALLSGMVMTAWDLVMDPLLSGGVMQAWVWEQGGAYFGVPAQNFVGWLATTFTVYLLYRLYERRVAPRPLGPILPDIAALPLVAYGAMMVSDMLVGGPRALQVIAPLAMGLPLLAAMGRLRVAHRERQS
jgi:putative membrane protein